MQGGCFRTVNCILFISAGGGCVHTVECIPFTSARGMFSYCELYTFYQCGGGDVFTVHTVECIIFISLGGGDVLTGETSFLDMAAIRKCSLLCIFKHQIV